MNAMTKTANTAGILVVAGLCAAAPALANGGPFVLKYPGGDPAAKGIVARLDPDLKPAREERLRVVREDLKITFIDDGQPNNDQNASNPALALVLAEYTIENPTEGEIEVDFGFPILRGIYTSPFSMMPRPDVQVRVNKDKYVHADIISNSAIYGMIRQRAREVIEKAVAEDATLAKLVATVRATGMVRNRARTTIEEAVGGDRAAAKAAANDAILGGLVASVPKTGEADHQAARVALADYLSGPMKWNDVDVALMVEFADLDFGAMRVHPRDRGFFYGGLGNQFVNVNLGPLAAIGEQKATQFFAKLAACFDPEVASTYESIFTAWGGDVRERSVDLKTGKVRPREITVDPKDLSNDRLAMPGSWGSDPTIYARVDYLDPNADITEAEKASCKRILKNLPVIFTFAPMNLLHYRVRFPAKATQTLAVRYRQYAYRDTREPASYQLAYVVHPASLWKDFGPINLEVAVPEGVLFRASVPCRSGGIEEREVSRDLAPRRLPDHPRKQRFAVYRAALTEKTGELILAVGDEGWKRMLNDETQVSEGQQQARR